MDINPAGLKLLGYSSLEEIKNLDIAKNFYINPEDRKDYLRQIKKNGFVKDYEIRLKKKDGSEIIVLETSTAIYDKDKKNVIAIRGIIRDITKQRKMEKQLAQIKKMEYIGTLAGGVAHDFNNLLTVINGYAEMALMDMDADNPLYDDILSILKVGKRAEKLTSQLLAFSRKQIYKPEIVNINEIIISLNKMMRRLIAEDIQIETLLEENIPNIKADKSQLEQIFLNLIVNARDALNASNNHDLQKKIIIETGHIFLDEEYAAEHPGLVVGNYIFFAVSDNGIGMNEEIKSKIFEPFFTTKEKYEGTGLGLSMVFGIVKQNKGSINVYSQPGQGTIFKIFWPITGEDRILRKKTVKEKISPGKESILIVEDDKEVCLFAKKALTGMGYNVHYAFNGRSALELIKEKGLRFDLIITDLIMPELNGKEFIKKVQFSHPEVKVMYVSGYTDNHIVHNGLLEEGVNFIHKPYSIKTLASMVRKVLDEG